MIMTWVGNGLVLLSAVLITMCVVGYAWSTRGGWMDSEHGRHVMAFMAVIMAVLGLAVLRVVAVDVLHEHDPVWFRAMRIAVFAGLPLVFAWRLAIIVRAAREVRREEAAEGTGAAGRRERATARVDDREGTSPLPVLDVRPDHRAGEG